MKDVSLSDKDRDSLIAYRVERAEQALKEAEHNGSVEYYNIAVNRLYYAAYYVISALLVKHGLYPSSHAGVKSMLGLHFVSTGIVSKEMGRIFSTLFNSRQMGDYEDFFYCDKDYYEQLFPQAQEFVRTIKKLIYQD